MLESKTLVVDPSTSVSSFYFWLAPTAEGFGTDAIPKSSSDHSFASFSFSALADLLPQARNLIDAQRSLVSLLGSQRGTLRSFRLARSPHLPVAVLKVSVQSSWARKKALSVDLELTFLMTCSPRA